MLGHQTSAFKSSINKAKTRTFPGADVGSDHDLVLSSLRLKLKHFQKTPRIRFDLEKLKDPENAEIFQAQVGGKFAALNTVDSDVDTRHPGGRHKGATHNC